MKLIFALIFVVLTTVVYANPLAEDFTDVEKENGNIQPNGGADELSDDGDVGEYLEDEDDGDDDDDDDDSTENDEDARLGKKKKGCVYVKARKCLKRKPKICFTYYIRKCKPMNTKCIEMLKSCKKGKEKDRKALKMCYNEYRKCRGGSGWSG